MEQADAVALSREAQALRAEWYVCLARAFLAPRADDDYRAFVRLLADDLAELGAVLGQPASPELEGLRASLRELPDHTALLELYSRLFLTPPVPAHLNLGFYLDGSLMGPSVTAMEDAYHRHGLARAEGFRDLADHLAVQLEFLAYLHDAASQAPSREPAMHLVEEGARFRDRFLLPALPHLCAALEAAVARQHLPGTYLHLARLLHRALEHEAAAAVAA